MQIHRATHPSSILAGMILLAMIVAGGWFWYSRSSRSAVVPPVTVGTPAHVLTFDDDSVLEIHEMAENRIELGTLHHPPHYSGNWSTSGGGLGSSENSLSTQSVSSNTNVVGLSWEGQPSALLVRGRLLDYSGLPVVTSKFAWGGNMKGDNSGDYPVPTWDAMINGSPEEPSLPEVLVQIADGKGGWITGYGPCCEDKSGLGIGITIFLGWPRSEAKLEFRAAVPGQKPVTWSMANPIHPVVPKIWTPDALPAEIKDPEYQLTFHGLHLTAGPSDLVSAEFDFISRKESDDQVGPNSVSWEAECQEIEGNLGGRSQMGWYPLGSRRVVDAAVLSPDEDMLTAHFVVRPTDYYRHRREDAVILWEGVIADDGLSIAGSSHDLAKYGLKSHGATVVKGSFSYLDWSLSFEWSRTADEAAGVSALLLEDGLPVCFVGDDPLSIGQARQNDMSRSSSDQEAQLELGIQWMGIPTVERNGNSTRYFDRLPEPGTRVTLGMVRPEPEKVYSFVVPRPSPAKESPGR